MNSAKVVFHSSKGIWKNHVSRQMASDAHVGGKTPAKRSVASKELSADRKLEHLQLYIAAMHDVDVSLGQLKKVVGSTRFEQIIENSDPVNTEGIFGEPFVKTFSAIMTPQQANQFKSAVERTNNELKVIALNGFGADLFSEIQHDFDRIRSEKPAILRASQTTIGDVEVFLARLSRDLNKGRVTTAQALALKFVGPQFYDMPSTKSLENMTRFNAANAKFSQVFSKKAGLENAVGSVLAKLSSVRAEELPYEGKVSR